MRVIDGEKEETTVSTALEIRRRTVGALVLRLDGQDDQAFFRSLDEQLRLTPDFLLGKPIILDLAEVAAANRGVDLIRVVRQLRTRKLVPIGVESGNATLTAAAQGAGLALFDPAHDTADHTAAVPAPAAVAAGDKTGPSPDDAAAAAPAAPRDALLWTQPVRSGQQIVCDWGDIIVTNTVGSGAELIAGGHIHVYGALRGRALAGVNGNTRARVFCQSLEAELVAIAGLYRVSDDFDRGLWRRPVQVFLQKDSLCIEKVE